MGKNTPERQDFIIDNLKIEEDLVDEIENYNAPESVEEELEEAS